MGLFCLWKRAVLPYTPGFSGHCLCVLVTGKPKAHSLVYRMGMHESQRAPDKVAEEATEYITAARKLVTGGHRDRRFIMNMDQTPVYTSSLGVRAYP